MRKRGTAVVFRDKHVLLVRDKGTRKFSLPGGKIGANEPVLAATIRNLYDELGITASKAERLPHCDFRGTLNDHKVCLIMTDTPPYLRGKELDTFIWWNMTADVPRYPHVDQILTKLTHGSASGPSLREGELLASTGPQSAQAEKKPPVSKVVFPSGEMYVRYSRNPTHPITSPKEYLQRRAEALHRQTWDDFKRNLPDILISRCPYCHKEIWLQEAGLIFSLTNSFWFKRYSNGRGDMVTEDSLCPHLFCVDGALNLNGHSPTEASQPSAPDLPGRDYILMAAEVPFVKPRLLKLPGMVAGVTDFPVDGGKYTAYPIVYFTTQRVGATEDVFCIPWATKEYAIRASIACGFGTRSDAQEYNLDPWLSQGKIYWLDKDRDDFPVINTPVKEFPYCNIPGRQHPYTIRDGRVSNLRQPTQGKPTFIWGD